MSQVCGNCKHFIGGGDWNLCCDQMYDLCYRYTAACEKYEYSPEKMEWLEQCDKELANYIRRCKNETVL